MGNRAVITDKHREIGIYVHWNGGVTSITGFLTYCKLKEYRNPNNDCYGWARLCQVIGNFFGGDASVGIDKYSFLDTDNGDNGVYVIDENWEICNRLYNYENEEVNTKELEGFILYLNEQMPKKEQIEEEELKEKLKPIIERINEQNIKNKKICN